MERKIGEVFEYNGEWYQCLESDGCALCNFKELINCSEILDIRGHCRSDNRSDGKSAIFKKLKKVGGPVIEKGRIFQCLKVHYMSCVECAFNTKSKACYKGTYIDGPCLGGNIWVEIKQNKENELKQNGKNMEESKTNCGQCGDKRLEVISKAKADLLKSTNIENDEKEMAVIDNILFRCAQMGWLEKYEKEDGKLNLKPFELQKAKAGKPVCTRGGRKARIICFDRKLFLKEVSYPILALVERPDGEDDVCAYNEKGKVLIEDDAEYKDDLMMIPERKEGWVNVYNDNPIYDTKERAELAASTVKKRIGTFKIFWEE